MHWDFRWEEYADIEQQVQYIIVIILEKQKQKEDGVGGINGCAGKQNYATAYTYNCYNIGTLSGPFNIGEITGTKNANGGTSKDINCYTKNATASLLNAGAYSDNVWIQTKGYPILNWQVVQQNYKINLLHYYNK